MDVPAAVTAFLKENAEHFEAVSSDGRIKVSGTPGCLVVHWGGSGASHRTISHPRHLPPPNVCRSGARSLTTR